MRNIRNILSVSCGYIAAIIGAGFASGQEILSFFVRYGRYSIAGIIISCVIFTLFAYTVLAASLLLGRKSYGEYLSCIMDRKVKSISELITTVFAFCSLCVMTACAGEMGFILFGAKKIVCAMLFSVLCGIIMTRGRNKVMAVNSVMGAVIIFGIIFSALYILRFREHQTFSSPAAIGLSGVAYAGYNLLAGGAVLAGMSAFLSDRREAALSALSSGIMLFTIMTLLWGLLSIYSCKINLGEIPMLTLALRQNKVITSLYSALLFLALLTTGVANCFSITDMIQGSAARKYTTSITLLAALALSGAGVSNLINTAYRLCGYAGIFVVLVIIFKSLKITKKVAK